MIISMNMRDKERSILEIIPTKCQQNWEYEANLQALLDRMNHLPIKGGTNVLALLNAIQEIEENDLLNLQAFYQYPQDAIYCDFKRRIDEQIKKLRTSIQTENRICSVYQKLYNNNKKCLEEIQTEVSTIAFRLGLQETDNPESAMLQEKNRTILEAQKILQ